LGPALDIWQISEEEEPSIKKLADSNAEKRKFKVEISKEDHNV
jgi:hypothetical protein